MDFHCKT